MIILAGTLLILSIVLFYSLKAVRKKFIVIEILILSLFNSFLCQHINFKIFSAYDRLGVMKEFWPRVISYLHFGIVLPLILMWILYNLRDRKSVIIGILLTVLWVGIDIATKHIYILLGVLESDSHSWYPIIDIGISIVIILFSYIFMIRLASILKKDCIING